MNSRTRCGSAALLATPSFLKNVPTMNPSPCGSSGGLFILVSPSVVVVSVGETLTPRASWCHDGRYDNVPAQWSLGQAADANIITLDATTGRITGRRTGQARVIATYEGADGAALQVTVR